jgi:L-aminopeptidase/D-esterase-like protein
MRPMVSGPHDDITDVPGVLVGHASDVQAMTGVTVIIPPETGAVGGAYIGGNASSTRQFDSLNPLHIVDRIHAVCFSGGSAYGLDAAGGVMRALEELGIGIPVVNRRIPIVPSAVIFDLNFGDGSVRPDQEMGRLAVRLARQGPIDQGTVGAGTGATVGKLFGIERGMKGGVGSASAVFGDLVVGALVVVNAYGDVWDPGGRIMAGAREAADSFRPADAAYLLATGRAVSRSVSAENTTLAVVAANARLSKITASWIASQATLGLGAVIRPVHSHIDGDLTVVIGVGEVEADPNRVGLIAAELLKRAVIKAVKAADGFGILPAWRDRESP